MKRLIDLIKENQQINEGCGNIYYCGGSPANPPATKRKSTKRPTVKQWIGWFAGSISEGLPKPIKGVKLIDYRERLESIYEDLYKTATGMSGEEFLDKFCDYLEKFTIK